MLNLKSKKYFRWVHVFLITLLNEKTLALLIQLSLSSTKGISFNIIANITVFVIIIVIIFISTTCSASYITMGIYWSIQVFSILHNTFPSKYFIYQGFYFQAVQDQKQFTWSVKLLII